MSVDLHLHTTHSDGNYTVGQLVEKAIELKLTHIAITDHDTTAGIAEAIEIAGDRIQVIPGIEINTIGEAEDGTKHDVHILGYFVDGTNAELKSVLKKQQQAREDLVDDVVAKLNELDIPLTRKQIQECAGVGSIGRPHITLAIVKAGGAADVNEAWEKFMSRKSPHYVGRRSVSPFDAIRAITACGGISSIAHPGKAPEMQKTILKLKEAGLRGVEAYHRRHSVDLVQQYIRFANKNGLLITGGSDCHGPTGEFPPSIGSISVPPHVVTALIEAASQCRQDACAPRLR
jgi:3',5'-nucleoside bisphosphate phosphatase